MHIHPTIRSFVKKKIRNKLQKKKIIATIKLFYYLIATKKLSLFSSFIEMKISGKQTFVWDFFATIIETIGTDWTLNTFIRRNKPLHFFFFPQIKRNHLTYYCMSLSLTHQFTNKYTCRTTYVSAEKRFTNHWKWLQRFIVF